MDITELKNKSILEVAQSLGMELVKSGHSTYIWKEHDSFTISPEKNIFKWWSRDVGGDVIKMVQVVKEVPFKEAAYFLQNGEFKTFEYVEKPREPFQYALARFENPKMEATIDYLKNERKLSGNTLDVFYQAGILAEANYKAKITDKQGLESIVTSPTIIFKSLDGDGNIIGTSMQRLVKHPENYEKHQLKKIGMNSDGQAGMSLDIGEPKRLVFFEAPIDLMSYYELHRDTLNDVKLVSMDGLKKATVGRYVADMMTNGKFSQQRSSSEIAKFLEQLSTATTYLQENSEIITLAVDNDEAGRKFIEKFVQNDIPVQTDLPPLPVGQEKMDWNDYLKQQKGTKIVDKNKEEFLQHAEALFDKHGSAAHFFYLGQLLGENFKLENDEFISKNKVLESETAKVLGIQNWSDGSNILIESASEKTESELGNLSDGEYSVKYDETFAKNLKENYMVMFEKSYDTFYGTSTQMPVEKTKLTLESKKSAQIDIDKKSLKTQQPSVTIYSKNNCMQCQMVKKYFKEHGVAFTERNVDENPQYIAYLKKQGWQATPVVESPQGSFYGFQPNKLREVAEANNPLQIKIDQAKAQQTSIRDSFSQAVSADKGIAIGV